MAYFSHAFGKAFYLKAFKDNPAQTSANLTAAGDFAVLNGAYKQVAAANVGAQEAGFYLAQGAFMANDTIGNNPGHGGYKESTKSKMIKYKYISDMWITECNDETSQVTVIELASTKAALIAATKGYAESCFPCGSDPIFRVDVKGTAALRLLNHNAYASVSGSLPLPNDASTAHADFPADGVDMCCLKQGDSADATNTITHTGMYPGIVALNLRDQINGDPILSTLGSAVVHISRNAGANGMGAATTFDALGTANATEAAIYAGGARGVTSSAGAGATQIGTLTAIPETVDLATDASVWTNTVFRVVFTLKTSCELQTQFSSCSFDTRDFYLLGGLKSIISLQDEAGNPCVACQGYVKDIPYSAAVLPKGADFAQRRTSSETGINDILMTENYRQSPYNQGNRDSARFRQQEGMGGIVDELGRDLSGAGTCAGHFKVYHMIHNVPRFNNPSGVFDNDQYHYRVYTKCSGGIDLDAEWLAIAMAAKVVTRDGDGIVTTVVDLVAKGGDL